MEKPKNNNKKKVNIQDPSSTHDTQLFGHVHKLISIVISTWAFWVSELHSRSQIVESTPGGASSKQLQGSRSLSFLRLFVCLHGFFLPFACVFCCFFIMESGRSIVRLAELWCGSKCGYFETGGSSIGSSY